MGLKKGASKEEKLIYYSIIIRIIVTLLIINENFKKCHFYKKCLYMSSEKIYHVIS